MISSSSRSAARPLASSARQTARTRSITLNCTGKDLRQPADPWAIASPRKQASRRGPIAHGPNEAGFFGNWNEFTRIDVTEFVVLPAHQGLKPAQVTTSHIDDGLVVEVAIVDRLQRCEVHLIG